MAEDEKARLTTSKVAKLIGLLPFLAGSDSPDRTALSHLAVWVVANRGFSRSVFDHRPEDDASPLARLAPIADFSGGDGAVLERGLSLLGLSMLGGYQRGMDADRALGAYNPLVSGAWNFEEVEAGLSEKVASPNADMDEILTADEAANAWWES